MRWSILILRGPCSRTSRKTRNRFGRVGAHPKPTLWLEGVIPPKPGLGIEGASRERPPELMRWMYSPDGGRDCVRCGHPRTRVSGNQDRKSALPLAMYLRHSRVYGYAARSSSHLWTRKLPFSCLATCRVYFDSSRPFRDKTCLL